MNTETQPTVNDVVLKRKVAEATQRIVKSSAPDVEGLGLLCGALGDLLGAWTGQRVRVLICADDQSDAVDMTKAPEQVGRVQRRRYPDDCRTRTKC